MTCMTIVACHFCEEMFQTNDNSLHEHMTKEHSDQLPNWIVPNWGDYSAPYVRNNVEYTIRNTCHLDSFISIVIAAINNDQTLLGKIGNSTYELIMKELLNAPSSSEIDRLRNQIVFDLLKHLKKASSPKHVIDMWGDVDKDIEALQEVASVIRITFECTVCGSITTDHNTPQSQHFKNDTDLLEFRENCLLGAKRRCRKINDGMKRQCNGLLKHTKMEAPKSTWLINISIDGKGIPVTTMNAMSNKIELNGSSFRLGGAVLINEYHNTAIFRDGGKWLAYDCMGKDEKIGFYSRVDWEKHKITNFIYFRDDVSDSENVNSGVNVQRRASEETIEILTIDDDEDDVKEVDKENAATIIATCQEDDDVIEIQQVPKTKIVTEITKTQQRPANPTEALLQRTKAKRRRLYSETENENEIGNKKTTAPAELVTSLQSQIQKMASEMSALRERIAETERQRELAEEDRIEKEPPTKRKRTSKEWTVEDEEEFHRLAMMAANGLSKPLSTHMKPMGETFGNLIRSLEPNNASMNRHPGSLRATLKRRYDTPRWADVRRRFVVDLGYIEKNRKL